MSTSMYLWTVMLPQVSNCMRAKSCSVEPGSCDERLLATAVEKQESSSRLLRFTPPSKNSCGSRSPPFLSGAFHGGFTSADPLSIAHASSLFGWLAVGRRHL